MRWKRSLVLLVWLMGILFPMAWLGKFSSKYLRIFNALFSPECMHWVMHAALFAGLTIILIWIFEPKISVKLLKVFIIVGLMTGLIQEGL